MWETPFSFTILELFTEIIRILMGLVIMKFGSLSGYKILNTQVFFGYLVLFKSWATLEFWFVVFIKCYSLEFWRYKMCIFFPLVDVSIRLSLLLGFVLSACGMVYTHFVLLFSHYVDRDCLAYMFSLSFSRSKFLINLRRQFRVRKFFYVRICSLFILCLKLLFR